MPPEQRPPSPLVPHGARSGSGNPGERRVCRGTCRSEAGRVRGGPAFDTGRSAPAVSHRINGAFRSRGGCMVSGERFPQTLHPPAWTPAWTPRSGNATSARRTLSGAERPGRRARVRPQKRNTAAPVNGPAPSCWGGAWPRSDREGRGQAPPGHQRRRHPPADAKLRDRAPRRGCRIAPAAWPLLSLRPPGAAGGASGRAALPPDPQPGPPSPAACPGVSLLTSA